jgi:hypothetical protein
MYGPEVYRRRCRWWAIGGHLHCNRRHANANAAIDLCIVPMVTFERLFAFLVVGHDWRRLLWIEVTKHPTAEWLARQMTEAFPWAWAPACLVRDNDEV